MAENESVAIRMIEVVERNLTERINVHRNELDHLAQLLDTNLALVAADVAEIKKQQAVQNALMEAGQKRINTMMTVAVGVAVTILAAALAIILFGPNPVTP